MSEHDNGGPAFPRTVQAWNGNLTAHDGMTLRDWFAGQALVGLSHDVAISKAGVIAYEYADAMLAARKGGAA